MSSSKRSKRLSVRKSLLGLVHSRSHNFNKRGDAPLNESTSADRKRWLNSRRFSKAPVRIDTPAASDSSPIANDSALGGASMQTSASIAEERPSLTIKGKGKEKASPDEETAMSIGIEAQQSAEAQHTTTPMPVVTDISESLQPARTQDITPLVNGVQPEGTDQNMTIRSPGISDPEADGNESRVAPTNAESHKENSGLKGKTGVSNGGEVDSTVMQATSDSINRDNQPAQTDMNAR